MFHRDVESGHRGRRGLCGGLAGLTLAMSAVVVAAGPAMASQQYRTTASVTLRSGPGIPYANMGSRSNGSAITVVCQTQNGSNVYGNLTWDKLDNGAWVSDYYTTSPSFNNYAPGLGACPELEFKTTAKVNVYYSPNTNDRIVRVIQPGTTIKIFCQTQSGPAVGGSRTWDELRFDDRNLHEWIPDLYTTTPVFNGPTPGLTDCSRV